MAERKFSFILLLLLTSYAIANESPRVAINNKLSACTDISAIKVAAQGSIPTLSFELKVNKSIAECGCKSALGSFTVFALKDDYKSYLLSGKIALMVSGQKTLPLSAEQNLVKGEKLAIEFACALPD